MSNTSYMKINNPNIKGYSEHKDFADNFEVLKWSWGAYSSTNPRTAQPEGALAVARPLHIVMRTSEGTPELYQHHWINTMMDIKLCIRDNGLPEDGNEGYAGKSGNNKADKTVWIIELKKATIASITTRGTTNNYHDSIEFFAREIKYEYQGKGKEPFTFNWKEGLR